MDTSYYGSINIHIVTYQQNRAIHKHIEQHHCALKGVLVYVHFILHYVNVSSCVVIENILKGEST